MSPGSTRSAGDRKAPDQNASKMNRRSIAQREQKVGILLANIGHRYTRNPGRTSKYSGWMLEARIIEADGLKDVHLFAKSNNGPRPDGD